MNSLVEYEMKDAVDELNQAQEMFDNANEPHRIDEAIARLKAAETRIDSIRLGL